MTIFRCIIILLVFTTPASAMDFEPFTYSQDFETRETMAWSSYPPIQDAAYEAPYIYPGEIVLGEKGTVLCKIIYPQWDEPQLTGIVKRLPMRLDNRSRIRFRYFIKTTVKPSWLGIDLPLADGGRIRSRFPDPETNRWVTVDLGIADILGASGNALSEKLDMTALAVIVRFEHADPDMPIMLGFDDITVSGWRPARFVYEEPRTEQLDEWESRIALKHYTFGDALTLRGTFSASDPDKVAAKIARFDRPEQTISTIGLVKKNGSWTLSKPLRLDQETFPAGMYEATITGTKNGEPTARSIFTFMVIDKRLIGVHPKLWFDRDGTEAFIARFRNPKNAVFLDRVRADAAEAREKYPLELPYDLPYFPTKGWLKSFESYRTRIATIPQQATTNAIVSIIDGDEKAAEWAKTALLSLCKWPTWTHPWMENRGHHIYLYQYYTTFNLALTYDMLYDNLSESERETVRDAFIRNGLKPSYRTYVVADQCTCNESNWITAIVGGSLAAACSVLGEQENTGNTGDTSGLEPWLSGCLYKLRAHLDTVYDGDSACIEGFGYGYGTMRIYSEMLPIIERCLNIDFSSRLRDQYTEGFWAADHDAGRYFTFGDAQISRPDMSFSPWLIGKYRDAGLAWLHDLNPPQPSFYTIHTVLYDIDDVPRKEPANLSGAKWFHETGTVVFRSGPGPEPFVLTFRCSPFGNHQHLDQGTFFLADRGELFITEQEYSNYYEDPIYQSHVIQPVGHNCILVDHNPQSQRTGDHEEYAAGMTDHAKITTFVDGEEMAFALGDLTPVYLGNVGKLERGILFLQPRTAVVIDRLETISGEATMDALFHGPKYSDIRETGDMFEIRSGKGSVFGKPIGITSPVKEITITPDPVKRAGYTDAPIEPMGRVTVTMETTGGKAMTAVVFGMPKTPIRSEQNHNSVFLDIEETNILLNGSGRRALNRNIDTDGLLAAVNNNGTVLISEGTYCSINGEILLKADTPVTVLIEGDAVSYSAQKASTIQIRSRGEVRMIIMNGKKAENWKKDSESGLISLQLPPGQGEIELMLR